MPHVRFMARFAFLVLFFSGVATAQKGAAMRPPELVLIFVVDGLRPDIINADNTPNLHRLRREGVNYTHTHSAFPTVTRVNAPVITSGAHPQRTGITSNTLFDRRVNGGNPFNTGDAENLWPFGEVRGGRLVQASTLGEMLTAAGRSYVAISSGSTGQALLLNPEVRRGSGIVINGSFEGGKRAAYPDSTDKIIRQRFGPKPAEGKADSLAWTERVLREYVLGELKPVVVLDWLTEPDGTQHREGIGSPATLAAIKRSDDNIGQTLDLLRRDGRLEKTAIIVTSDHGFAAHVEGAGVVDQLVKAGLKQSAASRELIMTSDSQSAQFFVEGRDPKKIRALVEFLQQEPWCDVVFVDAESPTPNAPARREVPRGMPPIKGWLPGTFSLQAINLAPAEGRPDVLVTLRWDSGKNAFGYAGRQTIVQNKSGSISSTASGHGGMSPWAIRTPLILWGKNFKERTQIGAPAGNVDITPTVLALLGVSGSTDFDGRVLREAFAGGPDEQKVEVVTETHGVSHQGYTAKLQISRVGEHRYVDKSWRMKWDGF